MRSAGINVLFIMLIIRMAVRYHLLRDLYKDYFLLTMLQPVSLVYSENLYNFVLESLICPFLDETYYCSPSQFAYRILCCCPGFILRKKPDPSSKYLPEGFLLRCSP